MKNLAKFAAGAAVGVLIVVAAFVVLSSAPTLTPPKIISTESATDFSVTGESMSVATTTIAPPDTSDSTATMTTTTTTTTTLLTCSYDDGSWGMTPICLIDFGSYGECPGDCSLPPAALLIPANTTVWFNLEYGVNMSGDLDVDVSMFNFNTNYTNTMMTIGLYAPDGKLIGQSTNVAPAGYGSAAGYLQPGNAPVGAKINQVISVPNRTLTSDGGDVQVGTHGTASEGTVYTCAMVVNHPIWVAGWSEKSGGTGAQNGGSSWTIPGIYEGGSVTNQTMGLPRLLPTSVTTVPFAIDASGYVELQNTTDVNPLINVSTVDGEGNPIRGYEVYLWYGDTVMEACFSPCSLSVYAGSTYQISMSPYGTEQFSHWSDGTAGQFYTVTAPTMNSVTNVTAYYSP